VKPSVLRFWETEFGSIRPTKAASGQRVYSRKHVERIMEIRELLYVKKFTIAGARRALREGPAAQDPGDPIAEVRAEVEELLRLCDE
jgi:DNA-binding transcriptional MerR regulator